MRLIDRLGTSLVGLKSRPGRTTLTALGIAIGIASMVAVVGISASSKAALLAELDQYGTNMLQVRASQSGSTPPPLPEASSSMLDRTATVTNAAPVITLRGSEVGRNIHDRAVVGVDAVAVDYRLEETLQVEMVAGRFFDKATQALPLVILGDVAAERMGITDLRSGPEIAIDGEAFAVAGVMAPLPLNPELNRSALIGDAIAIERFGILPNPTTVHLRMDPDFLNQTRPLLPRIANPDQPNRVEVSRPSDLLEARAQVDKNLQNLLLALGGVALLVGGIGIANVMIISVLERTGEIGLRRALGATRGHIRSQFVLEAGVLSALGGALGVGLGAGITIVYANRQDWVVDLPPLSLVAGLGAAIGIGILAGLYPATKAARLDPALAVSGAGR